MKVERRTEDTKKRSPVQWHCRVVTPSLTKVRLEVQSRQSLTSYDSRQSVTVRRHWKIKLAAKNLSKTAQLIIFVTLSIIANKSFLISSERLRYNILYTLLTRYTSSTFHEFNDFFIYLQGWENISWWLWYSNRLNFCFILILTQKSSSFTIVIDLNFWLI